MTRGQAIDLAGISAVLRTALDAVIVMDTAGVVRGWNAIAERDFGLSADQAIGRRMSELIIPARFREAHERGLTHFLATGEGPVIDRQIEIEALHADGHEVPIELSITYTEHFGEPVFLGFLRDVTARKEAERTQDLLIGELNHRVKNLLGVVSGMAHLTARKATSPRAFAEDFTARLAALGRSHELLTSAHWSHAPLGALVEAVVEPLGELGERIAVAGPPLELAPRDLIALGMILHELMTNAIKYGALADDRGTLAIGWAREGEALALTWREQTPNAAGPPATGGFGTRMIDVSTRHDLGGTAEWDWREDGLRFVLRFRPR